MTPKITWVNHASYRFDHGNIRMITDPWLFGSAFDDGWDLLTESAFTPERFADITHIWFSHEHPDHFAPQVLAKIPEDIRSNIVAFFQHTSDKRVASFLDKLGFKVVELPHRRPYKLSDDVTITCGKMQGIDSWLLTEVDGLKILNLNDCIVDSRRKSLSIKRTTGDVDVLMTQFAYANWEGNPEETGLRQAAAPVLPC